MRNKILAALFAAVTPRRTVAAVAGMSYDGPSNGHAAAMSYDGHGG